METRLPEGLQRNSSGPFRILLMDALENAAGGCPPGTSVPGPGFGVRLMGERDLDEVARIETATFTTPWSRRAFQRVLQDSGPVRAWVVCREGDEKPLGYAVYWHTDHEGELANLAVDVSWRGRGLGRTLMTQVIRTARADGVTELFLEVRASNQAALALYMKNGFERVGLRTGYYSRPVEDALVLRKPLQVTDSQVPSGGP